MQRFRGLPASDQIRAIDSFAQASRVGPPREWLRRGLAKILKTYGEDAQGRKRTGSLLRDIHNVLQWCCKSGVARPAINQSTFSRFLDGRTTSSSRLPLGHLTLFLLAAQSGPVASQVQQKITRHLAAHPAQVDFFSRLLDREQTSLPSREGAHSLAPELRIFDALLGHSAESRQLLALDFLRSPAPWPREDEAYYAVYRHSTDNGAIVKTFLVVQTPHRSGTRNWGFHHFLQGGPKFHGEISRISEGVVFAFPPSYLLLGFSYNIDVLHFRTLSPADREPFRRDIRGLELIAIEEADVKNAKRLFSGVMQTQAASGQPVVARAAFLYLGSSSANSRQLPHLAVKPTEIHDRDLEDDVAELVRSLRKEGPLPGSLLDLPGAEASSKHKQVKTIAAGYG